MSSTSLDEAKQSCAQDPSCAMFFDNCSKGEEFAQCTASATTTISKCFSTLYIKGIHVKYHK